MALPCGRAILFPISYNLTCREQRAQPPSPLRSAKLPQRLRLDLTNALAGHVELLPDFLKRVLPLAAYPKSKPDYFLLFGRKRLQDSGRLIPHVRLDHGVNRRADPAVFDQVAESRFAIAADRRLQRDRVARNGLQLLHFLDRNVHASADFFIGWRTAKFLFELTGCSQELVHALIHVHGNANGTRLVRNCPRNRLADPPRGVCRKLVPATILELI